MPESAHPDCLAGLAFVFTGELSSFSRDEATDLAKRFGGYECLPCHSLFNLTIHLHSRVVGQPSSKTSYVVLGENAGPSKIAALKKHNIPTLSEDEFLNLIATRKGPGNGKGLDEKEKKKQEKELAAIKQGAKELEIREKEAANVAGSSKAGRYDPLCDQAMNYEFIYVSVRRWLIPRRSFGRTAMPPKHSKRFAEIKARLRNFGSGCMIGSCSRPHAIHSLL